MYKYGAETRSVRKFVAAFHAALGRQCRALDGQSTTLLGGE
jgi:hypothetical protein